LGATLLFFLLHTLPLYIFFVVKSSDS
jgi:hypothetical protein